MAGQIEHLINDVYKKQIMIKDMSYRILQTQINPHFINNTLTMLDTLSKRNEPEKVTLIIQSISKMVRAAYAGNDMITLDEELDFLKAYLNVQKVRYEDRLFIEIDTVPECGLALIPKLTLQPITENSIKYGLESVEGRCEIHLSAHENGENVVIEISDNGPGMSEELIMGVLTGTVNARGSGLGIKNVHERIRIMFGETYGLAMHSGKTGGMTTTITIPGRKEPTDVQDAHRG
jgi:two-component system sensor histidine kinase YesM